MVCVCASVTTRVLVCCDAGAQSEVAAPWSELEDITLTEQVCN